MIEPSEGLAPILIQQMMEAIRTLSATTTVLLVEQNFLMASQLAKNFYIIDDGKSVHEGLMKDLVDDEEFDPSVFRDIDGFHRRQEMKLKELWRDNRMLIVLIVMVIVLSVLGLTGMGTQSFVRTALSGLTLGRIIFHGGSRVNVDLWFDGCAELCSWFDVHAGGIHGLAVLYQPHLFVWDCAVDCGVHRRDFAAFGPCSRWWLAGNFQKRGKTRCPRLLTVAAVVLGFIALRGVDFLGLADTAMVSITVSATDPLAEISAQEPLGLFWFRPFLLMLAGGLMALASARPGDKTRSVDKSAAKRGWIGFGLLVGLTLVLTLVRESGPVAVLLMNGDLRFVLALVAGTLSGFGLGVAVERVLVRTLYVRPFFIVLMTLGLSFVIREMVQLLWDPLAYQMSRPPAFSQPGKAENFLGLVQRA